MSPVNVSADAASSPLTVRIMSACPGSRIYVDKVSCAFATDARAGADPERGGTTSRVAAPAAPRQVATTGRGAPSTRSPPGSYLPPGGKAQALGPVTRVASPHKNALLNGPRGPSCPPPP